MIELVSVEVVNFRSFSYGMFAPLGIGQGMTAINGSNGRGKSSIVHAVVWALYGVTPDGVPVKALRRQGSEGEVRATVIFRHDGQTIEITRALRGRNDTTIAAITLDGVEQTNISTKTATIWVENRLGLDAEAFLTAFVVRQKELDSLVKARPADRRKTIERLAGIERMSSALELARADARQASRLLDALPQVEDPEVATKQVVAAEQALLDADEHLTAVTATVSSAEHSNQVAHAALSEGRQTLEKVTSTRHALEMAEQRLAAFAQEKTRLESAARDADQIGSASEAASKAREALATARRNLEAVDAAIAQENNENQRAARALAAVGQAREEANSLRDRLHTIESELGEYPDSLNNDLLAAQARVQAITDERGAARGEWERLNKSITTLTEAAAGHDATVCPTCSHALPDAAGLIADLTVNLDAVRARGTKLNEELTAAQSEVDRLEKLTAARNRVAAQQEPAEQALAAAAQRLSSAEDSSAAAEKAAEEARAAAAQARSAAKKASEQIDDLTQAEATAQATLRRIESAVAAAAELAALTAKAADIEASHSDAEKAHTAAKQSAAKVDLVALDEAATAATSVLASAKEQASAARTAHALASRDLDSARDALVRAQQAAEARRAALAEVERTSATASALEEFRRDRLARLAPELSEVASDFVSRMTDGKFTAVELDEEFTPVLTDSTGSQRPVAWLSGGEESAVALALRIAIGEVLAGQRGGLLVLDEVLTAQDVQRRQATMAAIRVLPRQVVTINHVSEATDMVDLVAEVVDDGDGASTIVDVVPDALIGSNPTDALLDA